MKLATRFSLAAAAAVALVATGCGGDTSSPDSTETTPQSPVSSSPGVDASTPETPEGETTAAPTADPAAAEDCALIEETTNARMASYEETPPTSAEENAAMMEDMGSVMSELSGQVSHPELVTALDQVSTMFAGLGELTAETEELMAQEFPDEAALAELTGKLEQISQQGQEGATALSQLCGYELP